MSFLVTGDLHITDNPRDRYRLDWLKRFTKLAELRKPGGIIILGDLTEHKDRHSAGLVNTIVDSLYALSRIAPVYGLQGNHDYVADSENGFWAFLSKIENLHWFTRPILFDSISFGQLLFLPHTRNYKKEWHGVVDQECDWIFCHNTFTGADIGHGRKAEGIPTDIFPNGARVISGDVHKPQTVGPVEYVGAPYLCDFGDDYTPRVLWLDSDKVTSLTSPGTQKRLITISKPEDLILQKHVKNGDILKVRVNLDLKERARWPELRQAVVDWTEQNGCFLHACQPQFKPLAGELKYPRLDRSKRSDPETLKVYAKARQLDVDLLNTGLELL